jgi:hypothetical protein
MLKIIINLILYSIVSGYCLAQTNTISIGKSFQEYVNGRGANNDIGGSMVAFMQKEDTQGSPYLIKDWAKGKVILKNQQVLDEPDNNLNYDKIQNQIIVRLSNNQILSVNMKDIQSFFLVDSSTSYHLTQIAQIPSHYVLELYKDSLYSLYKLIETKFYKADYENKGIYERGYKYDRYIDKAIYYLIDSSKKVYNLHNGSISELKKIAEDIPATKIFLKEEYNENKNLDIYLIRLVEYLNKGA